MIKLPLSRREEKGQAAAVFAVVATALVLFVVGVMDYMITTSRTMEAVAVGDLSAHAGAQELIVLPNGVIMNSPQGPGVVAEYFSMQAAPYMQLVRAICGRVQGKPACEVTIRVQSAGFLIPAHWITVRAVGYTAYGVTHEDQ